MVTVSMEVEESKCYKTKITTSSPSALRNHVPDAVVEIFGLHELFKGEVHAPAPVIAGMLMRSELGSGWRRVSRNNRTVPSVPSLMLLR